MPVSRRLLLLGGLGLALAPIALSACGGDTRRAETEGGAARTTQTTSTKAPAGAHQSVPAATVTDPRRRAYIAKTDRICRGVDPERNTAREQVGAAADTQEAAKSYEKETALGTSELKQLEAVAPPPGDAKLLQANVFGPVRHQLALRAQDPRRPRRRRRAAPAGAARRARQHQPGAGGVRSRLWLARLRGGMSER